MWMFSRHVLAHSCCILTVLMCISPVNTSSIKQHIWVMTSTRFLQLYQGLVPCFNIELPNCTDPDPPPSCTIFPPEARRPAKPTWCWQSTTQNWKRPVPMWIAFWCRMGLNQTTPTRSEEDGSQPPIHFTWQWSTMMLTFAPNSWCLEQILRWRTFGAALPLTMFARRILRSFRSSKGIRATASCWTPLSGTISCSTAHHHAALKSSSQILHRILWCRFPTARANGCFFLDQRT